MDVLSKLPKQLWLYVFFQLSKDCDCEHDLIVQNNWKKFDISLQKVKGEREAAALKEETGGEDMATDENDEKLLVNFDFECPPGFEGSVEELKKVRLVCKFFNSLLSSGMLANTFWATYWTKRCINDIRWFKTDVSWWTLANAFVEGRKKIITAIEEKYGYTDHHWVTANNRGLLWSNVREYDMALLDYNICEVLRCFFFWICNVIFVQGKQFEAGLRIFVNTFKSIFSQKNLTVE